MTETTNTPQPETKSGKSGQVEMRLRLVATPTSVEGKTIRYLQQNPHLSAKQIRERMLGLLCNLWLPYACQDLQDGDASQAAREAIYQLEQHIERIKRDFGLFSQFHPQQQVAIYPAPVPLINHSFPTPLPVEPVTVPTEPEQQELTLPTPKQDMSFYDSLSIFEN